MPEESTLVPPSAAFAGWVARLRYVRVRSLRRVRELGNLTDEELVKRMQDAKERAREAEEETEEEMKRKFKVQ
jgi:hypothetical protein